jgi:hypothetical protein
MATDFRDGTAYPRRGREEARGALWLLRIVDKARANSAGTLGEYIYPCPTDRGVLSRWGVTRNELDEAIRIHATDDAILAWFEARVDRERREAANGWLMRSKTAFMNRQDYDERVPGASKPPILPFDIVWSLMRT